MRSIAESRVNCGQVHSQGQTQRTSTKQKSTSPNWREKIVVSLFDPQEFRRKYNMYMQNEIRVEVHRYMLK